MKLPNEINPDYEKLKMGFDLVLLFPFIHNFHSSNFCLSHQYMSCLMPTWFTSPPFGHFNTSITCQKKTSCRKPQIPCAPKNKENKISNRRKLVSYRHLRVTGRLSHQHNELGCRVCCEKIFPWNHLPSQSDYLPASSYRLTIWGFLKDMIIFPMLQCRWKLKTSLILSLCHLLT